ncbi:MAG: extracellular solute-binding protein [Lachnospiraceae bacterium]|nr:extracellular solute-binding protein [Lachnospiraceae bacterium]
MKKRVLSILICMLLSLALAGCGGEEASGGGAGKLTLALRAGTYADVIKSCLPAFEEQYGVKCEVLELAEDDLHSKLALDASNAKGAYDLCMIDGSWMAEFTQNRVLADLSKLGYALDDDLIPATLSICYRDGDLYLAPFFGNVTVLLYNREMTASAGYGEDEIDSLDDIMAICSAAKESGKLGFLYRGDTENNVVVDFMPIMLSFGAQFFDEQGNPSVDTPEFLEALTFYQELVATGSAQKKEDLINSIDRGEAAMAIGWPGWYIPDFQTRADYCAMSGKKSAGSAAYNASVFGIWAIGITANSRQPELAEKLLEYLMDPEVQKSTIDLGGVPCRYSSLRDPEVLEKYPHYSVVCDALERGVYRPIIAWWSDYYSILGTEMGSVLNGVKSAEDGLKAAQSQLEAVADSYNR